MNEQRLQLVTFEQAKRLKELGFDWTTSCYYEGIKFPFLNNGKEV